MRGIRLSMPPSKISIALEHLACAMFSVTLALEDGIRIEFEALGYDLACGEIDVYIYIDL